MKRSGVTMLALAYFASMAVLFAYVFLKDGDTPIIPALLTLIPWGFIIPKPESDLVLPAVNIVLNSLILLTLSRAVGHRTNL